jgi:hypothetical protein
MSVSAASDDAAGGHGQNIVPPSGTLAVPV